MQWHLHQTRTEVLSWEYHVFEKTVDKLVDTLKKRKEAEENANKGNGNTPSMPKMQMPSMPSFKM